MDPAKVLDMDEIVTVLTDLRSRKRLYPSTFQNLILFELSTCCGLRCKEIAGLDLGDLKVDSTHPLLVVRKDNTKGQDGKRRARKVPLDLDQAVLADIREWVEFCRSEGRGPSDPVLCCRQLTVQRGRRLHVRTVFDRWKTAVAVLGQARVDQLSTHSGRHSFGTYALHAGYSLAEVRDWLGHSSISTTNTYTHAKRTDIGKDLFR